MRVKTQLTNLGELENRFPAEIRLLRAFYFEKIDSKNVTKEK